MNRGDAEDTEGKSKGNLNREGAKDAKREGLNHRDTEDTELYYFAAAESSRRLKEIKQVGRAPKGTSCGRTPCPCKDARTVIMYHPRPHSEPRPRIEHAPGAS